MKSQKDVVAKINTYKSQLAQAIEEKSVYDNQLSPDIDLLIFSLVDKLEALFWVLEQELEGGDMLDRLQCLKH